MCKRFMYKKLMISLLLLGMSLLAGADECSETAVVTEVADGVYVRQGQHGIAFKDENIANIGFIVGNNCVAVIDSGGSPKEGRALKCAIAATTDVPVCYVIISHHHFDHALGSLPFKQDSAEMQVEVIAHSKMATSLSASTNYYLDQLADILGDEASKEIIVLPDRTVEVGQPLELDLGDRVLNITAFPPAHTNNDLSIHDVKTDTLWLSDLLFVEHIPTLDGSLNGWLDLMNDLLTQTIARVIPGHGPAQAAWPQAGDDETRYFNTMRDQVRKLIEEGADIEDARDSVAQSEQDKWLMFDLHHKRNVLRAYTELEWE